MQDWACKTILKVIRDKGCVSKYGGWGGNQAVQFGAIACGELGL